MKYCTLIGLIASAPFIQAGSPFNWDLELAYAEIPVGSTGDGDLYGFGLTRFHNELQYQTQLPYDETAFGDRVGRSRVSVFQSETGLLPSISYEDDPQNPGSYRVESMEIQEIEETVLQLDFDYRSSDSPHIVNVELGTSQRNTSLFFQNQFQTQQLYSADANTYSVGVGYGRYLAPLWTASVSAGYNKEDGNFDSLDRKTYRLGLQSSSLWKIANRSWVGLRVEAGYGRSEFSYSRRGGALQNWTIETGGVVYPTRNIRVMLSHSYTFVDNRRNRTVLGEVSFHLTEALRLQCAAAKSYNDGFFFEPESLAFAAGYRF